ncbi:MAG TPA: ATP-binding protein [Acidimicrobiales bacterium]|nr:ATP-binding protein [Acidimicrobiales bacterium]
MSALATELRQALPFRHLDETQLTELAPRGAVRAAEAGEVVSEVGDDSDGLYVVLEGRVSIARPGPTGDEVQLGDRGPGGSFGEPSLLDPAPRSARVTALEPSRFFVLTRPAFLDFLAQCPDAAAGLLAGIGTELRVLQERMFAQMMREHALQVRLHAERFRSLARLVAGVAHEINTPLGIITTAASILAEDLAALVDQAGPITQPVQDALEAAELISSNLVRASTLVDRFKSLSTSQAVGAIERVDLTSVIEDVVALYAPKARAAGLTVEVHDRRPDPNQEWVGNAGHLAEVLLNLLSNVERYAYPGAGGGQVDIEVGADNGSLVLTVRDFGRGIPVEDQDRVWEPFFTTGRTLGGTGLGLAVVNNLVTDAMEGSIEIDSEPGAGTAVHLRLPNRPLVGADQ